MGADKKTTLKRAAAAIRHRARGLRRIRQGTNALLNRVRGRVAVLVYHRVACHVPDPHKLCVAPGNFEEHLAHLARHYRVLSMPEMIAGLDAGKLPARAVAITFDDGYADNLWRAKPLLEKYKLPATLFVTSGAVGQKEEFLSDELERILLASPRLPRSLTLSIGGRNTTWDLGDEPEQSIPWTMSEGGAPSSRHACFREMHRRLLPLGHAERKEVLTRLAEWSGAGPSNREDRRAMNRGELLELTRGGRFEIGAHTVHHVLLAARPIAEQREEITQCRKQLEEMLGRRVPAFAYPYGGPDAQTQATAGLAREAGFAVAFANARGLVEPGSDPFMLPRHLIQDWPEPEFAKNLKQWFCE
jgi:peptidoglycan/xylan/chitin deacetylase (PgdA/CDA1 family)